MLIKGQKKKLRKRAGKKLKKNIKKGISIIDFFKKRRKRKT